METVSGRTTRADQPVPRLLASGGSLDGRYSPLVGGNGSQGLRRRSDVAVSGRSTPRAISAVFPCYNDAATIGGLVDDVHDALVTLVEELEVIVVNDGSSDASREVLEGLAAGRPWLRVIHHLVNRGYGGALISGFTAARFDWVFYTDGDAQYDAKEIAVLVPLATDDVDIVQGYKLGRGDTLTRKIIGRCYHHVVKRLFSLPGRDTDCDFRLFRRQLIVDRPLTSSSGVICVEMMRSFSQSGARFVETPVHHYHRPSGKSQFFRIASIARSMRQLLSLWWEMVVSSSANRRTWMVIAVAAMASVLMRLRMLWSPVSVDEGGYLAIARSWAHGRVLYRDVFVDRPQGLLVLFRVWDWLSAGSTGSIRIMAMLFGVLLVVSTGIVVREVAGDVAARFAAMICAVVSAAPILEGYAANTELLSGAMSAAGLAVGVLAFSKHRPHLWFFASGLLAGVALSLKQSGFDGVLSLLVWLTLGVVFCAARREAALKGIAALVVGLMTILGALMLHGALTGWSRWWSAVAGYRLKTQSAFTGADWPNLVATAPYAAVVLGTSAFLAVLGAGTVTRGLRRRVAASLTPGSVVLVVWLVSATMAFLIGGGFWRHYWLLLAAPFSALAGVGLAQLPRLRYVMLAATLLPCLAITAWVYAGDPAHLSLRAAHDHHAVVDELVAKWFNAHRQPGQNMYVLCASAGVYADAHQDPGYPYLWLIEVHRGTNAQNRLVGYLGDPARGPHFIAEYQRPSTCDSSGRVDQILRHSYRPVAVVGNVTMFERSNDLTLAKSRAAGSR